VGPVAKKTFDKRLLEHPPRPARSFSVLFDTKVSGLAFRIPANGTPQFQLIARDHLGKEKRLKLADWAPNKAVAPDGSHLDLDQLRLLAVKEKAYLQSAVKPITPSPPTQPEWERITLDDALDLHIESGTDRGRVAENTAAGYRDVVRLHASDWRTRDLVSLSRREVRERHREVAKRSGPGAANLLVRVVSAAWNRAARQYPELGESPTGNVDIIRIPPRDYGVREEDTPNLWREINGLDPVRRDFYRTVMLTGLRRTSTAELRVSDYDQTAKTLAIAKPKGGVKKAFVLSVCNQLHEVLVERARASTEQGTPWLFPAKSGSGHIAEPRVEGLLPPHGFRHLYSSVAGNLLPAYPLKQLLNHALDGRDVTAGYVKLTPEQLRPHAQAVADRLFALIKAGTVRSAA